VNQWLRELRRRRLAPGRRRPRPGARWLGWAQSLAARRRRTVVPGSVTGMVLVRSTTSAASGVTRLPMVSSAWHLHLTLRQDPGPAVPTSGYRRGALPVRRIQPVLRTALNVPPTPVTQAAGTSMVIAPSRPSGVQATGERWRTIRLAPTGGVPAGEPMAVGRAVIRDIVTATVQRILERGRRVEERTSAADPASGLSGYPHRPDLGWSPAPPPTTAALPTQSPIREHGRGTADGPTSGGSDTRRTFDAPPPPPRIDVEQLADQVVRRIDDRIIAHRERFGRI
jgi:hypothetical protein